MTADESLYERLGGQEAIEAVVDEFYDRVLSDEDLEPYFEDTDTEELRNHQTAFMMYVTGGQETYDGADMGAAHEHLDVTDEAFGRVADHLDASLRACDVDDADRDEVMTAVAGLQDEIVTA